MSKQTVTDKDGNLYVAKPATDGCEGCVFNGEICCSSPENAHCEGLIYEKATPADIEERNSFDKAMLWLVILVFTYSLLVAGFIIHSITKYNNQLL